MRGMVKKLKRLRTFISTSLAIMLIALSFVSTTDRIIAKGYQSQWQKMSAGWTYYQKGQLQQSISVFANFLKNYGKYEPAETVASAYYGLGMCYAHSKLKMYGKALDAFKNAVKIAPNSTAGKNSASYIKNSLPPVQLDVTYQTSKKATYDDVISMIMFHQGYSQVFKNTKAVIPNDSKGKQPEDWAKKYVSIAYGLKAIPSTPDDYKGTPSRLWIVKFILNLKGYNECHYDKQVTIKDVQNISIFDQMCINTANYMGIMKVDKNGMFKPNQTITRTELADILKRTDSHLLSKINLDIYKNVKDSLGDKILQEYYVNDGNDSMKAQTELLQKHADRINQLDFAYGKLQLGFAKVDKYTKDYSIKIGDSSEGPLVLDLWKQQQLLKEARESIKNSKIDQYITISDGFVDESEALRKVVSDYLKDDNDRDNLENQIVKLASDLNVKGINLDFERIYVSDRNNFTKFVKELSDKLHKDQRLLTVALIAFQDPDNTDICAFDYKNIGKYADYVNIMFYDENSSTTFANLGKDGSIASAWWVDEILKYSVLAMDSRKILVGLANYGYDYNITTKKAEVILQKDIWKLKNNSSGSYKYVFDTKSRTPYIEYTDKSGQLHRAWFEDKNSMKIKINMVNKYNLAGISLWHLGYEDEGFWDTVK